MCTDRIKRSCPLQILPDYFALRHYNFFMTTIYSLLIVSTFLPATFVGLVFDGIRLLGIDLTTVVT